MELCEWNPEKNTDAVSLADGTGYEGCGKEATVSVGSGMNNYHLCDSCAELPRFNRFKKRSTLKKSEK